MKEKGMSAIIIILIVGVIGFVGYLMFIDSGSSISVTGYYAETNYTVTKGTVSLLGSPTVGINYVDVKEGFHLSMSSLNVSVKGKVVTKAIHNGTVQAEHNQSIDIGFWDSITKSYTVNVNLPDAESGETWEIRTVLWNNGKIVNKDSKEVTI